MDDIVEGQMDALAEVEAWAMERKGKEKKDILEVSDEDMPRYMASQIRAKKRNARYWLIAGTLNLITFSLTLLRYLLHPETFDGLIAGVLLSCFGIGALLYLCLGVPACINFSKAAAEELLLLKYARECLELRKQLEGKEEK